MIKMCIPKLVVNANVVFITNSQKIICIIIYLLSCAYIYIYTTDNFYCEIKPNFYKDKYRIQSLEKIKMRHMLCMDLTYRALCHYINHKLNI